MEQHQIEELNKLKSLLDSGVLTQEEFETEKEKVLKSSTISRIAEAYALMQIARTSSRSLAGLLHRFSMTCRNISVSVPAFHSSRITIRRAVFSPPCTVERNLLRM